MSKMARITEIIGSILMIILAVIFIIDDTFGYAIIVAALSLYFLIQGIKSLWFYIRMGRYMVGGRRLLYEGLLILDLGLFTMGLDVIPTVYVMIYLGVIYVVNGGIQILNAVEAKKVDSPHYKSKLVNGAINILIGILCFVFIRSNEVLVLVISAGLIYNAITKIVTATRRQSLVYVQ